MPDNISFKSRVRNTIIECANLFNESYVSHDYLLLSDAFIKQPYYIVQAHKDNFLHLSGVSTVQRRNLLSAGDALASK